MKNITINSTTGIVCEDPELKESMIDIKTTVNMLKALQDQLFGYRISPAEPFEIREVLLRTNVIAQGLAESCDEMIFKMMSDDEKKEVYDQRASLLEMLLEHKKKVESAFVENAKSSSDEANSEVHVTEEEKSDYHTKVMEDTEFWSTRPEPELREDLYN